MFKNIKAWLAMKKEMQANRLHFNCDALDMFELDRYSDSIKGIIDVLDDEKNTNINLLFNDLTRKSIMETLVAVEYNPTWDESFYDIYNVEQIHRLRKTYFYLSDEEFSESLIHDLIGKPIINNIKYNKRSNSWKLLKRNIIEFKVLVIDYFDDGSVNAKSMLDCIGKQFSRACPVFIIRYFMDESDVYSEMNIWYKKKKSNCKIPESLGALTYDVTSENFRKFFNIGDVDNE